MATVARIIATPLMFSLYFLVCGRRAYDFFLYQALYNTPAIARWQNIFLGTYTRISSPQVRNYRVIVMAYFFPFISEVETVTVITYESSNASKEIISIQCVEAICVNNTFPCCFSKIFSSGGYSIRQLNAQRSTQTPYRREGFLPFGFQCHQSH